MSYFKSLPNIEYHTNLPDKNSSLSTVVAKNFFRRAKIRADIFQNASFFTKYSIVGDERPDQVAEKFYDDPRLDWIVLTVNNIIDVYNEWPLNQIGLYNYMIEKYGSEEGFYEIKYYKTLEVRNSLNIVVQPANLIVDTTFYNKTIEDSVAALEYYDENLAVMVRKGGIEVCYPVTHKDYEEEVNDEKRNIFILRTDYLQAAINDLENIATYKVSSDYVSDNLKKTDNINLTN